MKLAPLAVPAALACIWAATAAASVPPSQPLLVTPTSIGGMTTGGVFSRFLLPSKYDHGATSARSGANTTIWWRNARSPYAQVSYAMDGSVVFIWYAGPLRTSRGDRTGTPLELFRRHWPQARIVKSVCSGYTNAVLTGTARVRYPAGSYGSAKETTVLSFGPHGLEAAEQGGVGFSIPGYIPVFALDKTLDERC